LGRSATFIVASSLRSSSFCVFLTLFVSFFRYLRRRGKEVGEDGWEFEPTVTSDVTAVERVTEIVREKVFRIFHKEIPYSVSYRNTKWEVDKMTNKLLVGYDLVVPTKSQKGIVEKRGWLIEEKALYEARKLLGIEEGGIELKVEIKVGKPVAE